MKDDVTYRTLLVDSPARMGLFVVGPVLIACMQLANSYVHDLPWLASIPFAAVLIAYSVVYARYLLADRRLRELETEVRTVAAD